MTTAELTQREIAVEVLEGLFQERSRVSTEEAKRAGEDAGVSSRTMCRAARLLGLRTVHNGPLPAFWERNGEPTSSR